MKARLLLVLAVLGGCGWSAAAPLGGPAVRARLLPQPQRLELREGVFRLRQAAVTVAAPNGADHEACRTILCDSLKVAGAKVAVRSTDPTQGVRFTVNAGCDAPPLPDGPLAREGYSLAVGPRGIAATAASPRGLLYAAQTLRQLARIFDCEGQLPALTIVDKPEFAVRGIYIEGGQERYGRIVEGDYLCEQVRRLSEFKMNTLVVECYNLFPYASFPACADAGTLSEADCRKLVAEAKHYHVTIVPSLQTLAQAGELVWGCDAGKPYREATAPGQMCPSTPEIYPFIKGLYRDLLRRFDDAPLIGVGCSEIDMQWQGRYCPKCQKRVAAGATVRELLLGHAEKCLAAVHEVAVELKRPVRPLIWADEFYMYGPGKDWVGLERIPRDTVMGYWKYWADYSGIGGLMSRGYDVLGISAIYNHTFYLADISPESPRKAWPPMEQTGVRNIAEMVQEAANARAMVDSKRTVPGPQFLGVATASFSKHRLRAFDSLWYGFVLNGQVNWSQPRRPLKDYQPEFTRAFVRHYYDCRTDAAADALADAWTRLDECKSQLELANQTLHDVVGVYDTQEPGYQGNTLMGAMRKCRELTSESGKPSAALNKLECAALGVLLTAAEVRVSLLLQRSGLGSQRELDQLRCAATKIEAHAEREVLMIGAQRFLRHAPRLSTSAAQAQAAAVAERWNRHRARTEAIAHSDASLYRQGDPCGHEAVLRDVGIIAAHFANLAKASPSPPPAEVLLEERFEKLDPARWIVLGAPKVVGGRLETSVSGGWDNRCGIATRKEFPLDDARPLVVEFVLTPQKMGIDSQIFAAADAAGIDAYRFSFYGPVNHFGVYTQSAKALSGAWTNGEPGWRLRAESSPVELTRAYRIRAEIRRTSFRVVVHPSGDTPWDVPLWDSGVVPMDPLASTRLRFADVEPPGGSAASRWADIRIWRP